MDSCIFCKIAAHEIPKDFTYEDETIMVFPDIHPIKPVHLLIVPKKHMKDFMELEGDGFSGEIVAVIQKMVSEKKLEDKGFRIVVNGGGSQAIDHLHFHLTGPWGKAAAL